MDLMIAFLFVVFGKIQINRQPSTGRVTMSYIVGSLLTCVGFWQVGWSFASIGVIRIICLIAYLVAVYYGLQFLNIIIRLRDEH